MTLAAILARIASIQAENNCTREAAFFILKNESPDLFDRLGQLLADEAAGRNTGRRRATKAA